MRNLISAMAVMVVLSACGGSKGDPGPAGAAGINGINGSDGMTILSGISCSRVDTGSGLILRLYYESIIYSTGDRFVKCGVDGGGAGYTNSQIYKSTQVGSTTGGCTVDADIDTATFGFWSFTSQNGTTKTIYNDSGSTKDQYTLTFAAADCTSF